MIGQIVLLTSVLAGVDGFHIEPYLQWPEPDAVTVMWETTERELGEVQFGATPEMGRVARESAPATLHEIRLTGLLPRTRYFYRVRCGGEWSEQQSFRTPPPPGTDQWRLVVYGDSRSYPDRHHRVAELVARFEPDLILHTGDQVARGSQRPLWKREFFDPAARLLSRYPVVTALGNHEEGSRNYFEYFALPGNERYYSLEFANAQIIVLDSNAWGVSARHSEQYRWLESELARPRSARWTLASFHHPLFSAHDKRSINRTRWDLFPLFEEQSVDLVVTGHDHFYYRSWPIGRLGSNRGMVHITSAGGGAPLYSMKERSYTAVNRSVHHCTVLDFDGDVVRGKAIDVDGQVFDEFTITKNPPPAGDFCAYEVYELERNIRDAIESAAPTVVQQGGPNVVAVDQTLRVKHTFRMPVAAKLTWVPAGPEPAASIRLEPDKMLELPVRARVSTSEPLPTMRLELMDDRFRNRQIDFAPLKIARDLTVRSVGVSRAPDVADLVRRVTGDDQPGHGLVRSSGLGPAVMPAGVHFAESADRIWVTVYVRDADLNVVVGEAATGGADKDVLTKGRHMRLLAGSGSQRAVFVVAPHGRRAAAGAADADWSATNHRVGDYWVVQFHMPRPLLGDAEMRRVNVVHSNPTVGVEDCLRPTFDVGSDPDRNPDFRFGDTRWNHFPKWERE